MNRSPRSLLRAPESSPGELAREVLGSAGVSGRALASRAFTDAGHYEWEARHLLPSLWRAACREEELPEAGCFVVVPLTPEGVVILRDGEGNLAAFRNICPHRGAPLACARSGQVGVVRCPYHGLAWDLALEPCPEQPFDLGGDLGGHLGGDLGGDPGGDLGGDGSRGVPPLARLAVDAWQGFVFVCTGPGSLPLTEALSPTPPTLAPLDLAALRLGRRVEHTVLANWKLLIENFQEAHHFPFVHPALEARTPAVRSGSADLDGPFMMGTMEIDERFETVSEGGSRRGRPFLPGLPPGERRRVRDYCLFPNLLLSVQPDYLLSYTLFPLGPCETRVVADIHFAAEDFVDGFDPSDVLALWDRVNREDQEIVAAQHRALAGGALERASLAASEDGIASFERRWAEAVLAALEGPASEPTPANEPTRLARPSTPASVFDPSSDDDAAAPSALARDPGRSFRVEPGLDDEGTLWGIWGEPYLALEDVLDLSALDELHEELCLGLARVETSYTGGSLKWMGVTAPWVDEDPYVDYMHVIEAMTGDELARFVSLSDDPTWRDPASLAAAASGARRFGDETDHPLNRAQMRYLELRHGVYFPWKVCYHFLENDRWEDKNSGAGKAFAPEARRVFPKTVAFLEGLPFREIGRSVLFGIQPNDHAPDHRDTEPGSKLAIDHSITLCPRADKRFYLRDTTGQRQFFVGERAYWFNDMDWHGVEPDPHFRYSIRTDGVFEPEFLRALRARHDRTGAARPRGPRFGRRGPAKEAP